MRKLSSRTNRVCPEEGRGGKMRILWEDASRGRANALCLSRRYPGGAFPGESYTSGQLLFESSKARARTSWKRNDIITIIDPEHTRAFVNLRREVEFRRQTRVAPSRLPLPPLAPLDPRKPTHPPPPALALPARIVPGRPSTSLGTTGTHDVEYPSGHPTLLRGADRAGGGSRPGRAEGRN